jgi:hypothetical protein
VPGTWFYTAGGDVHAFLPPTAAGLPPIMLSVCYAAPAPAAAAPAACAILPFLF